MSILYKQGLDRDLELFFPPSIDEYIDQNNSVRGIEDYVNLLDLDKLKFSQTRKSDRTDGQKAFSPVLLLKIFIYGYLNKIRSSRALARECKRNLELMWLTQGLSPGYHTISDFRKNNPNALKQLFKEFVLLCKNIDLIGDGVKAIDGAFLRANASKNQLIMKKTLEKDLTEIEEDIEEYLTALKYTDKEKQPLNIIDKLPKDLRKLKYKQEELSQDLKLLEETNKTQYNRTDPDATLMKKPAHNLMAYNTQISVDSTYKFIVATDISSIGNDTNQLHHMAQATRENLELDKNELLVVSADTGYYNAKELKKCDEDNINAIVPKANNKKVQEDKGKFIRDEFIYNTEDDHYTCPNNQQLNKRPAPQIKNDKVNYVYTGASATCKACPLKDKCIPTKAPYKQIFRWEDEDIIERHAQKMNTQESKTIVKKRGSIVEHPFGTIKRNLGWDHYLVRGTEKVSGENALIMFSYNFKRLLNIIGIVLFKKLIIALKNGNIEQIKEEIAKYIENILFYLFYFFKNYFIFKIVNRKLSIV